MVRNTALQSLQTERYFRWRGGDVSRVEGLTDAVLALAMTLLIVSLEVPRDYAQLVESFKQLPAFAVCFLLLVLCWFYHFQFHRRFGLENSVTIALNSALLFLLLFYVYPLKFMFTVLFDMAFFGGRGFQAGASLMVLYSGGYVGIFLMFFLMNFYAWHKRSVLELTAVEQQVTRGALREQAIHVGIGCASVLLAMIPAEWGSPAAGLVYFFVGPLQGLQGYLNGRKVERLAALEEAAEST